MKKLLGVILLGLLLSGNAYADEPRVWFKNENTIHIAHETHFMKSAYTDVRRVAENHCKSYDKYYFLLYESRPVSNHYMNRIKKEFKGGWVYEAFCSTERITSAPLKAFASGSDIRSTNFIPSSSNQNTAQSNTANSSSSSMSMKDKITQAKQVCTDLGFQQKTEKHADCSMQMMSIQFETTNKVASASGGTTQEVIVTHRNDYDIWDALLDFSAAIDPKNKTTTSSSSSNRGTNCVVGRTNPTFGTTTINCR